MGKLKLSSILLFALVVPFIMTYRISPQDTPYWLFGIIFLSLLFYVILDLLNLRENLYIKLKQLVLWMVIIEVIVSSFASAIIVRHQTAPVYSVHDIILQQESAIRFLLHGKNPYSETYFGTPLEQWHYSDSEINPALYHFVMEPFYLLFAIPFYFISNHTIGYFDGRIPLLFLFFLMLFVAAKIVKDSEKKQLFLILLAFNPAILGYTLEGRSDIFMFSFLLTGLYLLHKKRYFVSGIPIAFAFAVKQSAFPFFPFYVLYLYFKSKSISKTLKWLSLFFITFILIVLPFFLWNPKAFLDSTIFYLSGNTPNSYPISGYGFGKLLQEIGVIKDSNQPYSFVLWQFITGIPLLMILAKYLKKVQTISALTAAYGIFLFVFWYFSRYFNNSHLAYLSLVFITAYFFSEDKTHEEKGATK